MNKKIASEIAIGIIFLVAIVFGIAIYFGGKNISKDESVLPTAPPKTENPIEDGNQIACPADAKQCPDGSYVSRVAPNCEFAECTEIQENTEFIKYENKEVGISLEYPKNIYAEHIIKCKQAMMVEANVSEYSYRKNGKYYEVSVGTKPDFEGFGECQNFKPSIGYSIIIGNVQNENDIDQLIKKVYGEDCFLSVDKNETGQNYFIGRNWKDDGSGWACVGPYKGGIKEYSVEKGKIIFYDLGQEVLWTNKDGVELGERFFESIKILQ